jgi:hypothetical protein
MFSTANDARGIPASKSAFWYVLAAGRPIGSRSSSTVGHSGEQR